MGYKTYLTTQGYELVTLEHVIQGWDGDFSN